MGTVLTTITANDVDSSPVLTYRFGNLSSPGPFSIDRYGGKVVLRKRLDAETRSEYTLQVIASDGMHEAKTDLTVRVTDLNDNAPRFEQAAYVAVLPGTYQGRARCPRFLLARRNEHVRRERQVAERPNPTETLTMIGRDHRVGYRAALAPASR